MEGEGNCLSFAPIGWPEIRVHPAYILSDEELTVATLWRDYRGSGFGHGPLPFAGGMADQPSLVMDAFAALSTFAAILEPDK